jgi:hypothetical protein
MKQQEESVSLTEFINKYMPLQNTTFVPCLMSNKIHTTKEHVGMVAHAIRSNGVRIVKLHSIAAPFSIIKVATNPFRSSKYVVNHYHMSITRGE